MSNRSNISVIKRILQTVKEFKMLIIISLILTVLSVGLTLYIPILAGRAIDAIRGIGDINIGVITQNLILVVGCAVLSSVFQWIISLVNNKVAFNTVKKLRSTAISHINSLPISYIDSKPYGDILSRITSDADQFSDGLLLGFSQLFNGVVTILITMIFMVTLSLKTALVVIILTPISLFIAKFIATNTYSLFKKQSEIRGEQTAFINEIIGEQKTVQAFSYEKSSTESFDKINNKLKACSVKAIFFSSLTNPSTRFVNNLIYAAVALVGAFAAINSVLTVGGFVSFLSYANQYTKPFNEISGVVTELQNAFACAARIFELIDEEPQTAEVGNAIELRNVSGNIEMRNVCFSYDKSKKLLENVNLQIESGKKIAIVGPTGCGKTTLINLLMRFYDTDSGEIAVDGNEIKSITRESLRKSYGMVLQETWLKNGTVKENIAYGNPDATDEEIISAAKSAHAHSFIKRLPCGYDTVISDSATQLSQGERQLLCIARVILTNPEMLILDEATSSIDTRTELKVQDAFDKLIKGKTSFIVAHRLSTILDADLILVMRDGNIIEQGTHSELIAKNGFYTKLYNSQFVV